MPTPHRPATPADHPYPAAGMTDTRVTAFADAFQAVFPDRRPLPAETLARILASVDAAPPMTDRVRRRIGHLLLGGKQ